MNKTEAYIKVSEELKKSEPINKLIYLMEQSHTETYLHSMHVALLMACLCDELSFSPEKSSMMIQTALIHDVGKLDIPRNILDKKGTLSEKERKEVRKHPKYSFKTARRMKFSKDICKRVLLHHWRANKEGYPKMTVLGKELISDIELLAMCDMYSAIVQPRSYHEAYSTAYALSEIGREHFDIENYTAFKKVVEKNGDICFIAPLPAGRNET